MINTILDKDDLLIVGRDKLLRKALLSDIISIRNAGDTVINTVIQEASVLAFIEGKWRDAPSSSISGGSVKSIIGTAPIASSDNNGNYTISIAVATDATAGSMSAADFTKLGSIAVNATANSTDAQLRNRATHTGTQLAATISDFLTASRAQTEAMLTAGTNITLVPSGAGESRSLVINATAGLTGISGTAPIVSSGGTSPAISITAASDSVAGSMSSADFTKLSGITAGATANATDAQLRDRSTHTGMQLVATISDFTAGSRAQVEAALTAGANVTLTPSGTGATRSIQINATAGAAGVSAVTGTAPIVSSGGTAPAISIAAASGSAAGSMSSADFTKLSGITAGATANSTDTQLRDRTTHTGTQLAATIGDFDASSRVQTEAALTAGSGVTLTPSGSGATRSIQISAASAGISAVTGTAPIISSGGTTPAISITTATITADGSMSSADKIKLNGIATGATTNSTDATLLARANHTGTQLAATISDFTASSRAQTEATLAAGTAIVLTPTGSGASRRVDIAVSPATTSLAGSMSAADKVKLDGAVTAVNGSAPIISSGGATPSISINPATTLVAGSMSAADKVKLDGAVTAVSGTSPIVSSGGATPFISIDAATTSLAGSMSAADKVKLNGIATGATANATDASLRTRSSHTGTQTASTISDFTTAAQTAVRANTHAVIAYTATVTIAMATFARELRSLTLAGNVTFNTSGLAAGLSTSIRVICDATTRTLTFPATWVFIGGVGAPADIAAGKTGILSITAYGTTDSTVIASWAVQP